MAERPDDTRTRLLEAAGQVFAEKGYQAATVREICRRAGTNLASVNYYFRDKQGLYQEVVAYAHRGLANQPIPQWPAGTPPAQKLQEFIEQTLRILHHGQEESGWGRRLMMREMAEPTPGCLGVVQAFVRPKAERLGQILADLLPPETPEPQRHLVACSVVGICVFHCVHRPMVALLAGEEFCRRIELRDLAAEIARFVLAALGHSPPVVGASSALPPSRGPAVSSWKPEFEPVKMDVGLPVTQAQAKRPIS